MENLLAAWQEFVKGKRKKKDVQEFQHCLMDNVLGLHRELAAGTYRHGGYKAFKISDPKPRDIHKALVRDRLLHHALYRKLYPFFDRTWIADSYSCRKGKGTHRAMNRFRQFAYTVSKNHTRTCQVLKCDIRKFFAFTDQRCAIEVVSQSILDKRVASLITEVVSSFCSCCPHTPNIHDRADRCIRKGLPLGNLTSQLLVNVYMNEFDRYVKHKLKAKYHIALRGCFVLSTVRGTRHTRSRTEDCFCMEMHVDLRRT